MTTHNSIRLTEAEIKDCSKDVISVAIELYDAQKKGKPHTFTSIVKVLDGRIRRNEISKCLDVLTDLALATDRWTQREGWCKVIEISNDGIPLVDGWTKEAISE